MGDIQDGRKPERPAVEVLADGKTSLDSRLLIEDVNQLFGIMIEEDEVDTIGGWLYSRLKGEPFTGQKCTYGGIVFEITVRCELGFVAPPLFYLFPFGLIGSALEGLGTNKS